MSLIGHAPVEPIDAHLGATGVVLADEGATASSRGAEIAIAREVSQLRAVWIVDAPSRAAAIELARNAPGEDGTLEVRESFTPADFGAPNVAPPPPPPLRPDHHRYLALIQQDHVAEAGDLPNSSSVVRMGEYCDELGDRMLAGEGLKSSAKGARIRRRAAQRFVLDGPFAESKELVGGYLMLQARSLDDAVQLILPWLAIHRDGRGIDESRIEVRLIAGSAASASSSRS